MASFVVRSAFVLAAAVAGCKAPRHRGGIDAVPPPNGTYTFVVDREWRGLGSNQAVRQSALVDADYRPLAPPRHYRVTVADEGRRVTIASTGTPPLEYVGERAPSEDGSPRYTLTEGAFAGGHLMLTRRTSDFAAELTLYGSGVPVTSSERGVLEASAP